jgi:uroporphyrinogen-III synthase
MSGLILVIRPQPGSAATVEAGRQVGLTIEPWPLFEVQPVAWDPPSPGPFDALLLGSANAVRHAGPALDFFRGKPVYAVGETTAAAAEAAGFAVAARGRSGLQALLDRAASAPRRLLRLAGEEHVPLDLPSGMIAETRVVYRSIPQPLPGELAERLRGGALVLLHSGAAARHLASECDRLGLPRTSLRLAALGPRIGGAAGDGWAEVRSAAVPEEAALLALARDMCHELPPG